VDTRLIRQDVQEDRIYLRFPGYLHFNCGQLSSLPFHLQREQEYGCLVITTAIIRWPVRETNGKIERLETLLLAVLLGLSCDCEDAARSRVGVRQQRFSSHSLARQQIQQSGLSFGRSIELLGIGR
jgi:hypothetical protein